MTTCCLLLIHPLGTISFGYISNSIINTFTNQGTGIITTILTYHIIVSISNVGIYGRTIGINNILQSTSSINWNINNWISTTILILTYGMGNINLTLTSLGNTISRNHFYSNY